MARPDLPTIYCSEMKRGDLNIYLASSEKGAVRIGIALKGETGCRDYFKSRYPGSIVKKDTDLNRSLGHSVEGALLNKPVSQELKMDFSWTPFQEKVLRACEKIPFGETRTYGDIAAYIGDPKAARAVGNALGKNPLPLIFP